MKIGIDAKWLFTGQISGRIFIQNILPELFALYPDIEWHIFLNKKDKSFQIPFKVKNVKFHYVWASLNMLSNFYILPRLSKKLELDVVFFQTFSPKSNSFKSFVFIHDILFEEFPHFFTWKEKLYFKFVKRSCHNANRIITSTKTVKNDMIKFGYADPEKIDIATLGISKKIKPVSEFSPELLKQIKNKYQLPDNYVLFTGRLNIRKNIETLLKALPLIPENIKLVIVGEKNWKQPKFSQPLEKGNIHPRAHFTGFVPEDDLVGIYAMAKIFCFPSFAEGFGLPPLEAMASGVPVVVSDSTSLPEICGEAAIYVSPKDEYDIANKINRLLADRLLYEKKVNEGLEWIKQFKWENTAKAIMKSIIRDLETEKK